MNDRSASDVQLEPGEARLELFANLLRTDTGIDFSFIWGSCGLSGRATQTTLTDFEAQNLVNHLNEALKPSVVSEGGHYLLGVCQATGATIADMARLSGVRPEALEAFCRGEGTLSRAAFAKVSEASIQLVVAAD